MWLGEYIKDTADKLGWDKAVELRKIAGKRNGQAAVEFFKTHDQMTRLEEYGKQSVDFQDPMGWVTEYTATPSELTFNIKVCPLFDGWLEAGLSVEQINRLCKSIHIGIDEELKKEFPNAEFTSIPKPSKEESCIEKYTLPP
jgi:hypothetical protein